MTLSVFGCGYLGAVHAAAMAALGHQVIGVDVDDAKIEPAGRRTRPVLRARLPDSLLEPQATGRLGFSTDIADAASATVHFICVGTPQKRGENAADLHLCRRGDRARCSAVAEPGDLVVGKSTVPVGTAERLADQAGRGAPDATLVLEPRVPSRGPSRSRTPCSPDRLVYGVAGRRRG